MSLNKAAGKGQWREAFTAACEAFEVQSLGNLDAARRGRRVPANRQRRMPTLRAALGARRRAEGPDRQSQGGRNPRRGSVSSIRRSVVGGASSKAKPGDEEAAKAISTLSVEKTIQKGGYNQELLQATTTDSKELEDSVRERVSARSARREPRAAAKLKPTA